jgi:crotonobetainyl-CoA:carnitine CoA-transferase CaiB-like acyl-CoA transferase
MSDVMKGVRVLEVADYTFVPAASAILADWGADVIKIEHHERGDALRGLGSTGVMDMTGDVHVINEHSNRGKRSLGLNLQSEEGLKVLYKLAATCDVFITNKLPDLLKKLKIDVEDLRKHNPKIIYVRGTAFGPRGPDADKGGYDMTSFWCRSGCADAVTPPGMGFVLPQPAPAYGDSTGGMTIAGGIAAALFKRERTGEPSVVDVSLLNVGIWAMGAAIGLSMQSGEPWGLMQLYKQSEAKTKDGKKRGNPLTGLYETKDKRFISVVMMQGFQYWPEFCKHIDRQDLVSDERFNTDQNLGENAAVAKQIIGEVIKTRTLAEWTEAFKGMKGQWAPVQNTVEVAKDLQVRGNDYIVGTKTANGTAFELVASPVQFDVKVTATRRAPEFNEHGDEILQEAGFDMEKIIELKIAGAVT